MDGCSVSQKQEKKVESWESVTHIGFWVCPLARLSCGETENEGDSKLNI